MRVAGGWGSAPALAIAAAVWLAPGGARAQASPAAEEDGAALAARGKSRLPKRGPVQSPQEPKLPDKLPAAAPGAPGVRDGERSQVAAPGGYLDTLDALGASSAELNRAQGADFSYCLRVTATYEVVSFDSDGKLRRGYTRAVQHGTGFAFKELGGDYFVATNEHVVRMPPTTTAEVAVEGIPPGARKVREVVEIVLSEEDDGRSGAIELSLVLADPANDLAVLKTRTRLRLMPCRLGVSGELAVGNLVVARGYPLGVFHSSNIGRVTNARQEDLDGVWDHLDFVTDAALNNGNSGSPVFAISRRSHELELVGIFHAHYRNAQGMGVVIGIDSIREQLMHLTVPPPSASALPAREEVERLLVETGEPIYFPFAGKVARARAASGGIRFEVLEDFPLTEVAALGLISGAAEPVLERLAGSAAGTNELGPELREPVGQLEAELWRGLVATLKLRRAMLVEDTTPGARKSMARLRRQASGRQSEQKNLMSVVDFESERRRPRGRPASSRPAAETSDGE